MAKRPVFAPDIAAAIDRQHRSRDEIPRGPGQIDGGLGDILHASGPTHQVVGKAGLGGVGIVGQAGRGDDADGDGVLANIIRRPFHGQTLGQVHCAGAGRHGVGNGAVQHA